MFYRNSIKLIALITAVTLMSFPIGCGGDGGSGGPSVPVNGDTNPDDDIPEEPEPPDEPEIPEYEIFQPPDPADIVSELNLSAASDFSSSVEFLFTGTNPVQRGVEAGAIKPVQAGVVRGRVLDSDGDPLPGIRITILNHSELGYTYSRSDGMFDMAANGGGYLTFCYDNSEYIPAQRQVNVPWQNYTRIPDVVMLPYDDSVKTIDFSYIQSARSGVVSDKRGDRQPTLIFQEDTVVLMTRPDKSVVELGSIDVRATEYSAGEQGEEQMPARLPPTSGYTYCVEFSADEGKKAYIEFDQPVYSYVEDFIGFPVGSAVPNGYYDREAGQWVAAENGRVVQIIDEAFAMANVDTDGDSIADNTGLTDEERAELADMYDEGQVLWRVPITHFTPWDHNWPYGPPPDAPPPDENDPDDDEPECDPCEGNGSILEMQNQILGERVQITGTPFSLNYRSDRVRGNLGAFNLDIPLSGSAVHEDMERIDLEIQVAGQFLKTSYDSDLVNRSYSFLWDGRDGYGRLLQGSQAISVRIGYVYPAVYYAVQSDFEQSFAGVRGGAETIDSGGNLKIALYKDWTGKIGTLDMAGQKIGGWSIDVHHTYCPGSRMLYLGDGTKRTTKSLPLIISTIAGGGEEDPGDGGRAVNAALSWAADIAAGPDGSLYIAETGSSRIRRIGPDGIITTVAGTGIEGFTGDNGPAVDAQIGFPSGIAVGPDGSLYIADSWNNRIRRVDPDGIITTIAGNGSYGTSGDNGPAVDAEISLQLTMFKTGIKTAPDGSIYFSNADRVRRIGTNGYITTVAGGGINDPAAGGLAVNAELDLPLGLDITPDGNLYIADADSHRVWRVGPDGLIRAFAGDGTEGDSTDGVSALTSSLCFPTDVAAAPDGNIYVTDFMGSGDCGLVRLVGTDGVISTIAGGLDIRNTPYDWASLDPMGENISATSAFIMPGGINIRPDGSICITAVDRIRRLSSPLGGFSASDIYIPSKDGSEIYHFNPGGRHLKTINAVTKNAVYQFAYNSSGLLTGITDMNGLVTVIERDSEGYASAIISPYNQRTELAYDDEYLSAVTNPAGESYSFGYESGGLLTSFTDPRGYDYTYEYDSNGLLTEADEPTFGTGDGKTFVRTDTENGYAVAYTSAEGITGTYSAEAEPDGDKLLTNNTGCCENTVVVKPDGTQIITYADGTIVTQKQGPDPRWGMLAPVTKNLSIEFPDDPDGVPSFNVSMSHEADLNDPLDLFSVNYLTTTMAMYTLDNSDPDNPVYTEYEHYTSTYDAGENTLTYETMEGRYTIVILDDAGRIIQIQYGDLYPYEFAYNTLGQVSSITQDERVTEFVYDNNGYYSSVTDSENNGTDYAYDNAGRINSITLPGGQSVSLSYDPNGNLTGLTPPGKTAHTFSYNPVNLVSTYTPPDIGMAHEETSYEYDLDQKLVAINMPYNTGVETIGFDYDSAGRIDLITTPDGDIDYTYNSVGQVAGILSPYSVANTFTYNGFLLTGESWSGGDLNAAGVSVIYNNSMRPASTTVTGSSAISFTEDGDGLITGAGNLAIARDDNGFVGSTTLGYVTTGYIYNSFGEIESCTVNDGSSDIFIQEFQHDQLGRITVKAETINSTTITYYYTYDADGRLESVEADDGSILTYSYTYDANGNRMSYDAPGTGNDITCVSNDYDAQDRIIHYGNNSYTYMPNGELLSKAEVSVGTTTYDYDVLGNLINAELPDNTSIEYVIDGLNRRVGKKVEGILQQQFVYKDNLLVAELDGSGNLVSRFVYGTGSACPDYMINGGITFRIISDPQGSPRLVIRTDTGIIAQRIDYDEFGNIIFSSGEDIGFIPFGFAGGLYDPDTKLVRFGLRDYDSETGRWTSKDPIRFYAGTNMYEYVMSDPVNFIDPSGLCGGKITIKKGDVTVEPGAPCENQKNDIIGPIEEGFEVKEGDTVKTGPKSHVQIRLSDNSVLNVPSNSSVTITSDMCPKSKPQSKDDMVLNAIRRFFGPGSGDFTITGGTAIAGVRG